MMSDGSEHKGWISLHRKIKDHWLWEDPVKLKWWISILIDVNHCDKKILIGGKLIDCERGQSIKSLTGWAKEWNVTKNTVRSFFRLLKSDNMIRHDSDTNLTRITVLNYDIYQLGLHDIHTIAARPLHPNNNNNIIEDTKVSSIPETGVSEPGTDHKNQNPKKENRGGGAWEKIIPGDLASKIYMRDVYLKVDKKNHDQIFRLGCRLYSNVMEYYPDHLTVKKITVSAWMKSVYAMVTYDKRDIMDIDFVHRKGLAIPFWSMNMRGIISLRRNYEMIKNDNRISKTAVTPVVKAQKLDPIV